MATLNLSNQETAKTQIQPYINALKTRMDERKEVWARLPREKRVAWVKSGKDPIMTLAWQIYKYLRDNFFDFEDVE
jgi:hypothetical protein